MNSTVDEALDVESARVWPQGFLWGTGASSTQCEGAAEGSDWIDWERAGRAPRSGSGNGFSSRYREDFALLASLGLNHHRLSIEWARIEPEPGIHDHAAIEQYRNILQAARDVGITPWICLLHFTQPRWFAECGGFLHDSNRTGAWRRHVDFMAETFSDLAGGWQPVNETNYYAQLAYGGGGKRPPGHDDPEEMAVVEQQVQLANAEAAVRLRQTGLPVASIFGLSPIVTQDDDPASRATAERLYDSYWRPGLELFRDGVLKVLGRSPIDRPDLAHAFDLFGFSYYGVLGVRAGQFVPHPSHAPVSPLGYGIWADGLAQVLDELSTALPDTPLLVAEYGIGTDDDQQRMAYLERGIELVHDAVARGIDVRGLFHWTAVDNYEWLHGYDLQFGIIDADRNIRPSAQVLRREAGSSSGAA